MRRGFTLIQISILLTVAALVMVAILPSNRAGLANNNATVARMNAVFTALRAYEASSAKLPCPADASLPVGSANYGIAAANSGPGTGYNCSGGTPAANYTDTSNQVAIGMVPVRALGLSNDYALDGYGRALTYAVDTNATACFQGTLAGAITVTDNGANNSTVAALISHGADGHGAWIPLPGSSGTAVRLNAGSSDTDEHLVNAHGISAGGFPANYSAISSSVTTAESTTATFVRKPATGSFDDLVMYRSQLWMLNTSAAATTGMLPAVTAPANGSYYVGQTLSFIVTFAQNVTVTGTPRITITLPSGTVYANYASGSGSGSNALVFNYVVGTTDSAPAGMTSVTSPISPNGGSIAYASGGSICLTFTPPNVTGIIIVPLLLASPFLATTASGVYMNIYNMPTTDNFAATTGVSPAISLTTTSNTAQPYNLGPPDGGIAAKYSPDNIYLAFGDASASSPHLRMYKYASNAYTLLSSAFSTAQADQVSDISWSYGDNYLAASLNNASGGTGLAVYSRSSDSFALLATPKDASYSGMAVAFSHDSGSTYLAYAPNASGAGAVYKNASGSFSALTALSLTGIAWEMAFSPDDSFLAAATATSPYVQVYTHSGDTFSKLTSPFSASPTSPGRALAWSPNGTYLAVGTTSTPFIYLYSHSGSVFTLLTAPVSLPAGAVNGAAWSADGTYLALGLSTTPYLNIYKLSAGILTKITTPGTLPSNQALKPDFTHLTTW